MSWRLHVSWSSCWANIPRGMRLLSSTMTFHRHPQTIPLVSHSSFLVAWHLWSQPRCHHRPRTLCGLQLPPLLVAHHKLTHMFWMASCLCGSTHKWTRQHVEAYCILESDISSVYFGKWVFKCECGLCGYYSMCAGLGPILSLRPFLLPSTCRKIVE